MISTRKRKTMLKRLNAYFVASGKIPTEREYNTGGAVPYRSTMIEKYLGGWNKMVHYLQFYYPQWRVEAPTAPAVAMEAAVAATKEAPAKKPVSAFKKKEDAE